MKQFYLKQYTVRVSYFTTELTYGGCLLDTPSRYL